MAQSIRRLLRLRERAEAEGDRSLVREITWELRRVGYVDPPASATPGPDASGIESVPAFETADAAVAREDTARHGPGRARRE